MARETKPRHEDVMPVPLWNHRIIDPAAVDSPIGSISLPDVDVKASRALGHLDSVIAAIEFTGGSSPTADIEFYIIDRAAEKFIYVDATAGVVDQQELECWTFSGEPFIRIAALTGSPTKLTIRMRVGRARK